jgi:glycosyltransferase involved in cell wall biosynthesis
MKILYFAPIDWEYIRQRPQHLAQRLAKHFDFIYIQPLGLRNLKPSDFKRAVRRFFAFFKKQNPKDSLIIKNLIFLPIINPGINKINRYLLKKQLQALTDDDAIVWVTSPLTLMPHLLEELKFRSLVYEMMDDYAEIQVSMKKDIIETEMWLIRNASLVITTSTVLLEKAETFNKRTVLVGNGVDYDFFNKSRYTRPPELQGMRTIAGYVGSIDKWLDFETISFLAEQRKDVDFVFVGPVKLRKLPEKDNIHFLGQRDYATIPDYCNHFNVCLIPFTRSKLSDTINPVKLYEYFALGKPVVAYEMKEFIPFSDLLYLANDKEEFLHKVELGFVEKDDEIRSKRRKLARLNDWSVKTSLLKNTLFKL